MTAFYFVDYSDTDHETALEAKSELADMHLTLTDGNDRLNIHMQALDAIRLAEWIIREFNPSMRRAAQGA